MASYVVRSVQVRTPRAGTGALGQGEQNLGPRGGGGGCTYPLGTKVQNHRRNKCRPSRVPHTAPSRTAAIIFL